MKCVFDTDVIVAALRSPSGASAALLSFGLEGALGFALTVPLLLEYEAVCLRPAQLAAMRLSASDIHIVLDALVSKAHRVTPYYSWRPQLRDANDELVLEAAIEGQVSHLVTFNLGDFVGIEKQFGIRCLRPADTLRQFREFLS